MFGFRRLPSITLCLARSMTTFAIIFGNVFFLTASCLIPYLITAYCALRTINVAFLLNK